MNAKKIMGAVLVALLAAALFVGAAAAGDEGTFFVYQKETGLETGVWTGSNGATVSVADGVITPGAKFAPGTYKYNGNSAYITYPTAAYSIVGNITGVYYIVENGGNVYEGSELNITITPAAPGVEVAYVMVGDKKYTYTDFVNNATQSATFAADDESYTIKAIFNAANFTQGVYSETLLDNLNELKYTVVGEEDATLSASVDTVYAGEKVTLTVTGTPGSGYIINAPNVTITPDQYITVMPGTGANNYTFEMPNSGKASFVATIATDAPKEVVIKLLNADDAEVKIKIAAPVVTATLGAPAYFIGDDIQVTGTATAEMAFVFTISGTNIANITLPFVDGNDHEWGKEWKANLTLPADKKLDVGTYTIKVYNAGNVVATLPVVLKQPFISIADAPEVIAQNESATFLINAEAAEGVHAYFFGTNFFLEKPAASEKDDDGNEIGNLFNVTLTDVETKKEVMATGQYFAVFQHPMYNGIFNIYADEKSIYLNTTNDGSAIPAEGNLLFNVSDRQTANAAQALCDALDSQNIDDMYVKYSFFVVEKLEKDTFSMSEIPTEVVKGDKIVISGVDTASKEGTLVTVEMVSTAFAAVPKETVGSAAFILVTTTIAEDGTWEVTLDTSDLNVDEYSLSVAINSVPKESVTVNVIEGADEPVTPEQPEQPEQPENPEQPEAPATPGFGALAALAGLGAVAVLLLRRE